MVRFSAQGVVRPSPGAGGAIILSGGCEEITSRLIKVVVRIHFLMVVGLNLCFLDMGLLPSSSQQESQILLMLQSDLYLFVSFAASGEYSLLLRVHVIRLNLPR